MSVNRESSATNNPQSGMVAIMVTLIMMIVISLLVLGFAQVSRHEQHNTLDNQLSSQAYYAAESGVNDAASAVRVKLAAGSVPSKKKCNDNSNYNFNGSSQLGTDVSYSCVLIDPAPMALHYSVGASPVVMPMQSGSGLPFKTVTLSWTPVVLPNGNFPANPLGGCPNTAGSLPPVSGAGAWSCSYPMLRTELVPTNVFSRNSLLANTKVNFLEPVTSASGTATATVGGKVIGAKCVAGATPTCQVVFSGFTGSKYYMRLAALYGATKVTITATDATGPVGIAGAQANIDATGNAHGVLRRILVAVDLTDANSVRLTSAALVVGDSICKRFTVAKDFFNVPSSFPGGNGNPLCEVTDVKPPPKPPIPPDSCGKPKDVILTLDESSSMQSKWNRGISREDEMKNLSEQFVQNVSGKNASMRIGVVSFNAKGKVEQPLTNNYSAVLSAIKGMKWSGGTHYDEGLNLTESLFNSSRGNGVPQVMIFISDGKPDGNFSFSQITAQTNRMKAAGITIYTIGIYPADLGTGILKSMASSGNYIEAKTAEQMQGYFAKIVSDLSC